MICTYEDIVSICDAHGIGLPVDCVEMVMAIVNLARAPTLGTDDARPVAWTAGQLYDAIENVLLHYKLGNWQDQYESPLGLVDRLCDHDSKDIGSGQHQIRLICDEIYNEVLTVAGPTANAQAPIVRVLDTATADFPDDEAIARTKRILAIVDIYHKRPDRMNRNALRGALMDEFSELSKVAPTADAGTAPSVEEHSAHEPLGVSAPTESGVVIAQGWTGNTDIDAALLMLDRMDVSSDDDTRVDAISATLRKLASHVARKANVPDAPIGSSHAVGTEVSRATDLHDKQRTECGGTKLESTFAPNTQGTAAELSAPIWTVAGKGVWLREQIDEYVRTVLASPATLPTRGQAIEECAKAIDALYKQPESGRRKVSTGYDEGHNDALDEAQRTIRAIAAPPTAD